MLFSRLAAMLAALALPTAVSAVYGVDVSQPVSLSAAKCMKDNGRTFAVVRAWCSYGGFDGNAAGTVANFWNGGMEHVDVYMFPCRGQSASGQVNTFVDGLQSRGMKYGMVWLDIETNPSPGCGWSGSNCEYMGELVSALHSRGVNVGTYSSSYMWDSIMGGSCTVASSTPLWYPHYDGVPSFSDFAPFGGWRTPAIKQYSGSGSLCGVGVDSNYYP